MKEKFVKFLVKIYHKMIMYRRTFGMYKFENRKKNSNKLLIIIAGYKPFLYETIFNRIIKYKPTDIEVCIVSSGLYDKQLSNIAKENDWSYLSTKRNCVDLVQNIAIKQFDKAEYIYKLDEDVFITERYFETLLKTYEECENNGNYRVGFVAPLIPINGYGNFKVLKRFNAFDTYTKMFERPLMAAGRERMIESNPDAAMFMWGKDNFLPSIDEMNKELGKDTFSFDACPIKFSIGAILFKRKLWENMLGFYVDHTKCMGRDEEQICAYCMNNSKAIIVSNNCLVGHLSFGKQNQPMKEYYLQNKMKFDVQK